MLIAKSIRLDILIGYLNKRTILSMLACIFSHINKTYNISNMLQAKSS